jgi:hypothetical protein
MQRKSVAQQFIDHAVRLMAANLEAVKRWMEARKEASA